MTRFSVLNYPNLCEDVTTNGCPLYDVCILEDEYYCVVTAPLNLLSFVVSLVKALDRAVAEKKGGGTKKWHVVTVPGTPRAAKTIYAVYTDEYTQDHTRV